MIPANWAKPNQTGRDVCPQCETALELHLPRRPGYRFNCPSCQAWLTWCAASWETVEKMGEPLCSVCGSTMVKRQGKYGEFWGCSEYKNSKCRGKPGQRAQIIKRVPTCELGLWREPDPELHAWCQRNLGQTDEMYEREERREAMVEAARRKARGW